MAKSAFSDPETAEVIEEALDLLDRALDRVKTLYEQYFLGIQKQPPTHLHNDTERKIRDVSQMQIRNTALRYRFATVQQKYGSYNAYWRRTLRQIENGTYVRQLQKVGRDAARTGAEVPEEILAQMPKRMREQVKRDREIAVAQAARRTAAIADGEVPAEDDLAWIREPTELRRKAVASDRAHRIAVSDADMDLEAFFAEVAKRPTDPPPLSSKTLAKPTGLAGIPLEPSGPVPVVVSGPVAAPVSAPVPAAVAHMPSQQTRPVPIMPGASGRTPVPVATLSGPFPRPAPPPLPKVPMPARPGPVSERPTVKAPPIPQARPPLPPKPPAGMTDADVNALYAKYVKAKEMVGEKAGPGSYGKLMKTIHDQAPKIMAQYKAKGVDFSVVVKDNQVVIKAKPKL